MPVPFLSRGEGVMRRERPSIVLVSRSLLGRLGSAHLEQPVRRRLPCPLVSAVQRDGSAGGMTEDWRKVAAFRRIGANFQWGVNEQSTRRHAFPDRCFWCETPEQHRRTHVPIALCGKAWAAGYPIVDDPSLPTCRSCQRMLIGGWP